MIRNNGYYQQNQIQQQKNTRQKQKTQIKKQVRLSISFKDNEVWLYNELKKHSSPAAHVKDILFEHFSDKRENGINI